MQEIQTIAIVVYLMLGIPTFIYAAFLGLWFVGAPPFHRAYADTSQPVRVITMAACPRCGYQTTEFMAFVRRVKLEEHGDGGGQSDMLE